MKEYDMELSKENIIDSIKKDSLERNIKLNRMISLLNNISCNK